MSASHEGLKDIRIVGGVTLSAKGWADAPDAFVVGIGISEISTGDGGEEDFVIAVQDMDHLIIK